MRLTCREMCNIHCNGEAIMFVIFYRFSLVSMTSERLPGEEGASLSWIWPTHLFRWYSPAKQSHGFFKLSPWIDHVQHYNVLIIRILHSCRIIWKSSEWLLRAKSCRIMWKLHQKINLGSPIFYISHFSQRSSVLTSRLRFFHGFTIFFKFLDEIC